MVFCGWFRDVSKKWTKARSFEAPQNAVKEDVTGKPRHPLIRPCGYSRLTAAVPTEFFLLLDGLDLHEVPDTGLGVGGLDEGGVTLGVAGLVKGDGTGDALIGHAGQSRQPSALPER